MKSASLFGLRGIVIFVCVIVAWGAKGASPQDDIVLSHESERLVFNDNGALLRWKGRIDEASGSPPRSAGRVRYEGKLHSLTHPSSVSRGADELAFTYVVSEEPRVEVTIAHHVIYKNEAWIWTREVRVKGPSKLTSDLSVAIDSGLETLPRDTWLPLENGVGATLETNQAAVFHLAGTVPKPGVSLALPMISVPNGFSGRLLMAADPYFSTLFTTNAFAWTYPAKGGLENGSEKRTLVVSVHDGSEEDSLERFFDTMMPDIPPGPKWLHDIAMVDYDYMSDGGQGWVRDIDALAASIPEADRSKVLIVLHGWYDFLGRYCFDAKTGKFDEDWMVFSSYGQARKTVWGDIGGDKVSVGFANCKPVKMSLKEVHVRLNYARSRGFRVGIYFADGMNAGDGLPGFDPKCVLEWGGWPGADVKGKSYVQNPLQPKVRDFYMAYAKAMLEEFGPDIDMLNWDETFHIPAGKLGTEYAPGYADRATMRLTHDITVLVNDYNRTHHQEVAFLTSDCLGAVYGAKQKAPYALMAHGTYQDSWCQPGAWSYGIFPNYRNVLWSVCWWPVTKWPWVEFGVRNYQAAVSISNGWGDDTGFGEMTDAQRAKVLKLFKWRKNKETKLRWFKKVPSYPDK